MPVTSFFYPGELIILVEVIQWIQTTIVSFKIQTEDISAGVVLDIADGYNN